MYATFGLGRCLAEYAHATAVLGCCLTERLPARSAFSMGAVIGVHNSLAEQICAADEGCLPVLAARLWGVLSTTPLLMPSARTAELIRPVELQLDMQMPVAMPQS